MTADAVYDSYLNNGAVYGHIEYTVDMDEESGEHSDDFTWNAVRDKITDM